MEAREIPKSDSQILRDRIRQGLRAARHKRGISQDIAGNLSGVYRTQISNIERGYTAGTVYTLVRLCRFYNLSLDELCGLNN